MSFIKMENIEQGLIELIADYLDSDEVIINEAIERIKDPNQREKTTLHIEMAKAAFEVYKKTMINY